MHDNDTRILVNECLSLFLRRTGEIDGNVERQNNSDWDSLKHVELIFMMEDRTGIRFTQEEIAGIKNTDDIVRIVETKNGS